MGASNDKHDDGGLFAGFGEDVGEIVYNLIGVGLMAKTDEDSREDFDGVMAFDETMDQETSW